LRGRTHGSLDLLGETKAYGQELMNPLWSFTDPGSARDELEAMLPSLVPTLTVLPRRLLRIVESVERNEVEVGVRLFRSERDRQYVSAVVAQLVGTLAAAATGMIGGLLILAAGDRLETDTGRLLQAGGVGCVAVAVLALLSTLVTSIRRQRERA
jgi:ubiquinone biosynthesis protein